MKYGFVSLLEAMKGLVEILQIYFNRNFFESVLFIHFISISESHTLVIIPITLESFEQGLVIIIFNDSNNIDSLHIMRPGCSLDKYLLADRLFHSISQQTGSF